MRLPSIQIWLYKDDFASLSTLITRLPAPQRVRALQLQNNRQREFVIGRSLLALAIQHNSHSKNWRIRERPELSPIVEHPSQQFVSNISHSKGWVALAFCETHQKSMMSVGLDIELIRPRQKFAAAKFFCNSSQLGELNAATTNQDKSRYFSLLWTQKEAYFKARQQTIWNSRIKTISFNKKLPKDVAQNEALRSAYYGHSLVLSVFCNTPSDIDARLISEINPNGVGNTDTAKLQWQSYCVTGGNQ